MEKSILGNSFSKLKFHLGPAPSEMTREALLGRCQAELTRMNEVITQLSMSRVRSGKKSPGVSKKTAAKKQKSAPGDETLRAIAEAAGMTLEQLKETL